MTERKLGDICEKLYQSSDSSVGKTTIMTEIQMLSPSVKNAFPVLTQTMFLGFVFIQLCEALT